MAFCKSGLKPSIELRPSGVIRSPSLSRKTKGLGETETSFATQRNTKRDIKVVNSHFLNRRSHCADQSLLCFTLAARSILTTLDPSNSTQNSETILQSKPGPGTTHAIGSSQTNSALVTPLSL